MDVTNVGGTVTRETTPYSAKWRGFAGENRHVVKEALIDLAEVYGPLRQVDSDGVIFISPSRKKNGSWESASFRLFSFSKQDGWTVETRDEPSPDGFPSELGFFFEQIALDVRAIRVDSGEEMRRRVTLGFDQPKRDDETHGWITSGAIRVQLDDIAEATGA